MTKLELTNKIIIGALALITVFLAGQHLAAAWPSEVADTMVKPDPYKKVELEAKAAVVYNPETNEVLYAKNAYASLPLASITKVMTALVATNFKNASSSLITVSNEALQTEGDSGLLPDEKWSISKLVDFTLVSSSNDGAAALAAVAGSSDQFVSLMNEQASQLGLESTHFYNPTGLDLSPGQAGAYGSALDTARLFSYILKNNPATLSATAASVLPVISANDLNHIAKNTDELVGYLPGLFASKTGFTDLAGGNLAIAVDVGLNQPLVIVVLGSSEEGRFRDVLELINASLHNS